MYLLVGFPRAGATLQIPQFIAAPNANITTNVNDAISPLNSMNHLTPKTEYMPNGEKNVPQLSPSNVTTSLNLVPKSEEQYSCDYCEKVFKSKHGYVRHFSAHTCRLCGKRFSVEDLRIHMTVQHPQFPLPKKRDKCNLCGKELKGRPHYHMKTAHSDVKLFSCNVCSKSFTFNYMLTEHMARHTTKRLFNCETCGKSFKTKKSVKAHNYTHLEKQIYNCEVCNKGFTTRSSVKTHVDKVHKKIFKCNVCTATFSSNLECQRHRLTHEEDGKVNFVCSICNKGFPFKLYLNLHMQRTHREDRFMCDVCGKTVTSIGSLRNHKLTHSGVKPFQCNTCGKMFSTKKNLMYHVPVHTGERRHKCDTCGKTFTQRTPLVLHMRKHTGETPYKCELCGKAFISRCLMNGHKKRKHKILQ